MTKYEIIARKIRVESELKQYEAIRDKIAALDSELSDIENAEQRLEAESKIGKCYKFSNSDGSSERWPIYAKIVRVKDDEYGGFDVFCWNFQKMPNGEMQVNFADTWYGSERWVETTPDEFATAWAEFRKGIDDGVASCK